jgi:CHAD domain-containing protein
MLEREAKLVAPTGFQLPQLGGPDDGFLAESQPVRRYTTTYWDTPDLRLARWGASLRYRDDEGWTVKQPADAEDAAGMLVRQERTFDGKPHKVPEEAAALLRIYVRSASLQPVARLRAVRQTIELRNAAGERLAELVDDQVQVVKDRRVVDRFRELEVELGDGAQPDTLDKVLARLQEAGASQQAGQLGKYRRALGDHEVGPAELQVSDLDHDASVEQLLHYDLAASALRLFRHEPAVRLGEDPEAVHQARVGIRRLRSTLRTFMPLLDQEWADRLRDELKWLANLLGDVRDADVLHARLTRRVAGLPHQDAAAAGRLLQDLLGQRDAARERLLQGMDEPRYPRLLDDLVAAAQAPPVLPEAAGLAAEAAPPLVAKAWRKLKKAVKRAAATPSDGALHRIRIRAKRARYAAEAVKPVVGKPARAFAKAASGLQDELGEQHDAVVAQAWLREKAGSARGAEALAAGQLIAAERAAAQTARERWRPTWKKLAGKNRTGWL